MLRGYAAALSLHWLRSGQNANITLGGRYDGLSVPCIMSVIQMGKSIQPPNSDPIQAESDLRHSLA